MASRRTHNFEIEVRSSSRGGQPLEILDVLCKRVNLLVLVIIDTIGIGALFLQMTPPGLPLSMADLTARIRDPTALMSSFWFYPFAGFAAIFPVLCGGILGVLLRLRFALWLYALGSLWAVGTRLYLTFEMSRHENAIDTTPLLVDSLLMTICVFVGLSACDSSASLALDLAHNDLARRHARALRSGRGGSGSSRRLGSCGGGGASSGGSSRRRTARARMAPMVYGANDDFVEDRT